MELSIAIIPHTLFSLSLCSLFLFSVLLVRCQRACTNLVESVYLCVHGTLGMCVDTCFQVVHEVQPGELLRSEVRELVEPACV